MRVTTINTSTNMIVIEIIKGIRNDVVVNMKGEIIIAESGAHCISVLKSGRREAEVIWVKRK